ncbi:MAG: outer membrane protein transport protein [SAR324 cluster bacterium]|nr:outer membrane protein transport protein [SAR324 cluster bacterium]
MYFKKLEFTLLSIVTMATAAWGNGYHTTLSDAASLGQALAGITRIESSTTALDLPASMTFLEKGMHVLGGGLRQSSEFSFKGDAGKGRTDTEPVLGLFASAVWNNQKIALGISQNFPFNSAINWKKDWVGRRVLSKVDLHVGNTSPVFAYRIGNFSYGGGLNFYEGVVALEKTTLTVDDNNEVRSTLGGDRGTGIGYNLSFVFNSNHFNFGISHHSPVTLKTHGGDIRFDTKDELTIQLTPIFPDTGVRVELLLPSVTRIGLAAKDKQEDPNYLIEMTFTRTGWSNYRELRFRFEKPVAGSRESVAEKHWIDTTEFSLGGNYVFKREGENSMRVRGGIFYQPSPIPKKVLDPFTPDTSRNGFAVGLGIKRSRLLLDISYLTETFPERSSTLPELAGTYDGNAHVIAAGVGYHW